MKRYIILLGLLLPLVTWAQDGMEREDKKIKTENLVLTINKALKKQNLKVIKAYCSNNYWKKYTKNGEKFFSKMIDSSYLFKITDIHYHTNANLVEATIIDSNGVVIKRSLITITDGKRYLISNIIIETPNTILYSASPSYFDPEIVGVRPGLFCIDKKLRCLRDSVKASSMNITNENITIVGVSFADEAHVSISDLNNSSSTTQVSLTDKISEDVIFVQDNTLLGTENLGLYVKNPKNINKTYEISTYDNYRPTLRIFIK